ncbi:hypothetical protein [Halobacillus sp. B23F22_1]|uniref:hypothetical protein n=1 Tax=Halobacillus sp. B23F22_1 TaxID=3459514 RepID=UPI00373FB4AE
MSISLVAAIVLGFFYPAWKDQQREQVSDKQLFMYRGIGIAIPLTAFVILQLVSGALQQ